MPETTATDGDPGPDGTLGTGYDHSYVLVF